MKGNQAMKQKGGNKMQEITILAITHPGSEYLYYSLSAHKVSKASAQLICKVCNQYKFKLKEGECWHVYEVGLYDGAYDYAQYQRFTVRKGIVTESIT